MSHITSASRQFFRHWIGLGTTESERRARIAAYQDFFAGPMACMTWLSLAVYDIRIRYRRTFLGPLWITIGTVVGFAMMSSLFSAVLKKDIRDFLPYLSSGMFLWTMISGIVSDAPNVFVQSHHIINSMPMPLTTHVLRCVARHGLIFLHNLVAYLAVAIFIGFRPGWEMLALLGTLPLALLTLYFVALVLAVVGARFRDIGQMIAIGLQVLFFMTPIIWHPSDIPLGRKYWVALNPAYHLVELVRAPMTGFLPSTSTVLIVSIYVIALAVVSLVLYSRTRRRIGYWL